MLDNKKDFSKRNRRLKNHSMIGLKKPKDVKVVSRPPKICDLVLRSQGQYPSEHRYSQLRDYEEKENKSPRITELKEQIIQTSDQYTIEQHEEEIAKSMLGKYDDIQLEDDLRFFDNMKRASLPNIGIKYVNISQLDKSQNKIRVPSFSKLKLKSVHKNSLNQSKNLNESQNVEYFDHDSNVLQNTQLLPRSKFYDSTVYFNTGSRKELENTMVPTTKALKSTWKTKKVQNKNNHEYLIQKRVISKRVSLPQIQVDVNLQNFDKPVADFMVKTSSVKEFNLPYNITNVKRNRSLHTLKNIEVKANQSHQILIPSTMSIEGRAHGIQINNSLFQIENRDIQHVDNVTMATQTKFNDYSREPSDRNTLQDDNVYSNYDQALNVMVIPNVKTKQKKYLSVPVAPELSMNPKAISKLSQTRNRIVQNIKRNILI